MLRAVTLDYWDTIYAGASEPERVLRRQEALLRVVRQLGATLDDAAFIEVYKASAVEAHRWWRDEHRGYHTSDRIHWILDTLEIARPSNAEVIAAASSAVDQTLIDLPAQLLPGAREAIERLRERFSLAIISDTGFASGHAQNVLLENDGLRSAFTATIYSMDVGHAKPRPEIFAAAVKSLGVQPGETLHVGDNERTDVGGALAFGLRAVRLDAVRESGISRAEHVARSLTALADYLVQGGNGVRG